MERELLSKLLVVSKQLLAMKVGEDSVERVMKSVDDIAAWYMPSEWIDQPKREEVSQEDYWQQVEKVLAANGNNN